MRVALTGSTRSPDMHAIARRWGPTRCSPGCGCWLDAVLGGAEPGRAGPAAPAGARCARPGRGRRAGGRAADPVRAVGLRRAVVAAGRVPPGRPHVGVAGRPGRAGLGDALHDPHGVGAGLLAAHRGRAGAAAGLVPALAARAHGSRHDGRGARSSPRGWPTGRPSRPSWWRRWWRPGSRRPCSRACSCGWTWCGCRPRARGSCPGRTCTGSRRSTCPRCRWSGRRPRSCSCGATWAASARRRRRTWPGTRAGTSPRPRPCWPGSTCARTATPTAAKLVDLPDAARPDGDTPAPRPLPVDVRRAAPARARQARPDPARRAPGEGVRDEDAAVDPDLPRGRARRGHVAVPGRPGGADPVHAALARGRPGGRRGGRAPHGVPPRRLTDLADAAAARTGATGPAKCQTGLRSGGLGAQRERAGAGRARRGGLGLLAAGGGRGGRAPHEHAREEPDRHQQRDDQDGRQAAGLPRGPPLGDGVVGRPGPRPAAGSTTGIASVGASSTSVCPAAAPKWVVGWSSSRAARPSEPACLPERRRAGWRRTRSTAGCSAGRVRAESWSAAGRVAGTARSRTGRRRRGSRRGRADRRGSPPGDTAPVPGSSRTSPPTRLSAPGRVADLVGTRLPAPGASRASSAARRPAAPRTPIGVGFPVRRHVASRGRPCGSPAGACRRGRHRGPPSRAADADPAVGDHRRRPSVGGRCGAAPVVAAGGASAPRRPGASRARTRGASPRRRRTGEALPVPARPRRGLGAGASPPTGSAPRGRRRAARRRAAGASGDSSSASRGAAGRVGVGLLEQRAWRARGGRRSGGSSGSSGHS